jgi:peptidoglycan-associated lipoprotein
MCWLFVVCLGLSLSALSGCKPTYPNCGGDNDCPGNAQGKEWCVNGQCQQCRPDGRDCAAGKACVSGRCAPIPGYCSRAGGRCNAGKCEADSRKQCKSSDECAETEDCINGRCTPVGRNRYTGQDGGCKLDTVFFGLNEFDLASSNSSVVDRNAECVKKGSRSVTLVGHTDPRGTPEYNLALSDKRAQAVKRRMRDLGVSDQNLFMVPRGEMDSTGTDESSWSQDRRVEVNWR